MRNDNKYSVLDSANFGHYFLVFCPAIKSTFKRDRNLNKQYIKMPFTADAVAAQQVQERLKSLYGIIHEIDKKRTACEQSVNALRRYSNDEKGQSIQVSIHIVIAVIPIMYIYIFSRKQKHL